MADMWEGTMAQNTDPTRRQIVRAALSAYGLAVVGVQVPAAAVAQLLRTPQQTRGPFYPTQLPLDRDNDLVTVAGRPGTAKGDVADVSGRILNERGRPIPNARVEIWQCDANGRYRHPWDRRDVPLDPNFQGYGQFITGPVGVYRFRTIKPVPYPGRAPHIHFAISGPDFEPLITQMYVAGAPENDRDSLLNGIPDAAARQRLTVPFERPPAQGGALVARFDVVLAADGRFGRRDREYERLQARV
jgi:protocatechuate 3,4-dioxygenase beta subunit